MADRFNGYKRTGNRISLLDISRYCGLAGELGETNPGVGRAAEMSKTFHAMAANDKGSLKMFARLDDEEQSAVQSWRLPDDVQVGPHLLRYADGRKEESIGLDESGRYVDPSTKSVFLRGDVDLNWVIEDWEGMRVAAVCDYKKSRFTTAAGPDTLQNAAYGFAIADKYGCDAFVTGLWYLEEGQWNWSDHFVDLSSSAAVRLWERIVGAGQNRDKKGSYGAHCTDCWERLRCAVWAEPAFLKETDLHVDPENPDPAAMVRSLLAATAMEDLAKRTKATLKEIKKRHPDLRVESSGKEWRSNWREGSETTSVAAVRAAFGAEAEKAIKKGSGYSEFRWVKA